jgi:hypothetical protein
LARSTFASADGGDGGREAEARAAARKALDAAGALGINPEDLGFVRVDENGGSSSSSTNVGRCIRCGKDPSTMKCSQCRMVGRYKLNPVYP